MKIKITFFVNAYFVLGLLHSISAQHHFKLELVKDINLGGNANPSEYVLLNNKIYFTANDGTGRELWVSDGTKDGTYMVKDIYPNGNGYVTQLTLSNNKLFFTADDGIHGKELWVSNGTEQGTYMVKDINLYYNPYVDSGRSSIWFLGGYNHEMYFVARDDVMNTPEVWKTDGTTQGTKILKDINPFPYDPFTPSVPYIEGGIVYKNRMYFTANDGVHDYELWSTDGTEAGTYMVKDINPDGNGQPGVFYEYKGLLYFNATDSNGSELWVTDGTTQGTHLFADIVPSGVLGDPSSNPHSFKEYNGDLYFPVQQATSGIQRLYRTDGVLVEEVLMPLLSITWNDWSNIIYKDKLYFSGLTDDYGAEPWVTDGTFSGTKLVNDVDTARLSTFGGTVGSHPGNFFEFNDNLFFEARGTGIGRQIWVINDENYEEVNYLKTNEPVLHNGASGFSLERYMVIGDYCYFTGNYDGYGTELWRMYDSTKVIGVSEVEMENLYQVELYPNPSGSSFVNLKYQLSQTGNIKIQLYDVSGRWVQSVINENQTQGNHQIQIPLEDVPEGIYLIEIQTAQGTQTLKFVRTD